MKFTAVANFKSLETDIAKHLTYICDITVYDCVCLCRSLGDIGKHGSTGKSLDAEGSSGHGNFLAPSLGVFGKVHRKLSSQLSNQSNGENGNGSSGSLGKKNGSKNGSRRQSDAAVLQEQGSEEDIHHLPKVRHPPPVWLAPNGESVTALTSCIYPPLHFLSLLLPSFFLSPFFSLLSFSNLQPDTHFMKKLPPGSEASNVLVGEVDFLSHPIIAFVRLSHGRLLGDLTEVPIPTRFLFILLAPKGNHQRYHEIGRSIATLMSDEVCVCVCVCVCMCMRACVCATSSPLLYPGVPRCGLQGTKPRRSLSRCR